RRQPAEVDARLLVRDLVQLPEPPDTGQTRRLGLQVGGRVAGESTRLVRLRVGHPRVDVIVDEEPPDVLVRDMPDELFDVDPAVAERAALAVGLSDLGLDGDDTLEPWPKVAHAQWNLPHGRLAKHRVPPRPAGAGARLCTPTQDAHPHPGWG